jgi:hypothetical protein
MQLLNYQHQILQPLMEPGREDSIYGGDVNKWVKAAYTLKARYQLHLSKINPTMLQQMHSWLV